MEVGYPKRSLTKTPSNTGSIFYPPSFTETDVPRDSTSTSPVGENAILGPAAPTIGARFRQCPSAPEYA